MKNNEDNPPATEAQQIDALKQRLATLEGQVLNCLKFMAFQAEKEVDDLDQSWTPANQVKAEA